MNLPNICVTPLFVAVPLRVKPRLSRVTFEFPSGRRPLRKKDRLSWSEQEWRVCTESSQREKGPRACPGVRRTWRHAVPHPCPASCRTGACVLCLGQFRLINEQIYCLGYWDSKHRRHRLPGEQITGLLTKYSEGSDFFTTRRLAPAGHLGGSVAAAAGYPPYI